MFESLGIKHNRDCLKTPSIIRFGLAVVITFLILLGFSVFNWRAQITVYTRVFAGC